MTKVTRELLISYLEDALSEAETSRIEQELRSSEALQRTLRSLMQQRDRGEHSIGAIWCRHRLTCPSREQLGSYLLGVLDPGHQQYIEFHLGTIACAFCQANLADLRSLHQEPAPKSQERRKRFFESSAGLLSICSTKKG